MIEKLDLPFSLLSDPDRSGAIEPYGVADVKDPRSISRPAIFVVAPDSSVTFSVISTDFADRSHEDAVIDALARMNLPTTNPEVIEIGHSQPGPHAMPVHALEPYYRGAKFAGTALKMRDPDHAGDFDVYIEQMDRYLTLAKELRSRG